MQLRPFAVFLAFAVLWTAVIDQLVFAGDTPLTRDHSLGLVIGQADVRVERPANTINVFVWIDLTDVSVADLESLKTYLSTVPNTLKQSLLARIEAKFEDDEHNHFLTAQADKFSDLPSLIDPLITTVKETLALAGVPAFGDSDFKDCNYRAKHKPVSELKTTITAEVNRLSRQYVDIEPYEVANSSKYQVVRPFIRGHIIYWSHGRELIINLIEEYSARLEERLLLAKALKGQHMDINVYNAVPEIISIEDGSACFESPYISALRPLGCEAFSTGLSCSIKTVGEGSSNLYTRLMPVPFFHDNRVWKVDIPDTLVRNKDPDTPPSEVYDLSHCAYDESRYLCPRQFVPYQDSCLGLSTSEVDHIYRNCWFVDSDPVKEAFVVDTDFGTLIARQSEDPTTVVVGSERVYDLPVLVKPGKSLRVTFNSISRQLTTPGVTDRDGADLTLSSLTEKDKQKLFYISGLELWFRKVTAYAEEHRGTLLVIGACLTAVSVFICCCRFLKCCGCAPHFCTNEVSCCPKKRTRGSPKAARKSKSKKNRAAAASGNVQAQERAPLAQPNPPTPPRRARVNPTRAQGHEIQYDARTGEIYGMMPMRF